MRKILLSILTLGLIGTAGCSASDSESETLADDLTKVSSAVGFVFVDTGAAAYERCVATLIAPTKIVTKWNCLSTDFSPTTNGGAAPTGAKVYFVPGNAVGNRASWIAISKVKRYQRTALATLARASTLTPIPVTATPLAQADVNATFVAPVVTGGPYTPAIKVGSTQLRAVTGQGMKAIYPTLTDWANATQTGQWATNIVLDGPKGYGAMSWQHPLLNGYESLTRGKNETELDVATASSGQGGPLLRKVGSRYEVVAIAEDVVGAQAESGAGRNAVLATYYTTINRDIAAFLGGANVSENHCLGVPLHTGVCVDGFTFNCTDWGSGAPSVEDVESTNVFCPMANKTCFVRANTGSVVGSMALCR